MPATTAARLRALVASSAAGSARFPVALVVIRRPRRWWRRYPDLFAIVAPDQIRRFRGYSRPTRAAPAGSRFPSYTLPSGECLVGFGHDPHRTPGFVLRQAERIHATTSHGTTVEGFLQFMIHAGPGSFGCFTLPPGRWKNFFETLHQLATRHGNHLGHTDAGLYDPEHIPKTPLVPLITRQGVRI